MTLIYVPKHIIRIVFDNCVLQVHVHVVRHPRKFGVFSFSPQCSCLLGCIVEVSFILSFSIIGLL
jgi:hypothetical protein